MRIGRQSQRIFADRQPATQALAIERVVRSNGPPQAVLLANTDAREQRRIPILSEQVPLRVVNLMGPPEGRPQVPGSAFATPPLRTTA
jgi:hypothetical protein